MNDSMANILGSELFYCNLCMVGGRLACLYLKISGYIKKNIKSGAVQRLKQYDKFFFFLFFENKVFSNGPNKSVWPKSTEDFFGFFLMAKTLSVGQIPNMNKKKLI